MGPHSPTPPLPPATTRLTAVPHRGPPSGNDGYLILVSAKARRWIANLRMNSGVHAACFSGDGSQLMATGGG